MRAFLPFFFVLFCFSAMALTPYFNPNLTTVVKEISKSQYAGDIKNLAQYEINVDANISGDSNNALYFGGQLPAYYLDYANLLGTPDLSGYFLVSDSNNVGRLDYGVIANPPWITAFSDTNWQTSYPLFDANMALNYYKQTDANNVFYLKTDVNSNFVPYVKAIFDVNLNTKNLYSQGLIASGIATAPLKIGKTGSPSVVATGDDVYMGGRLEIAGNFYTFGGNYSYNTNYFPTNNSHLYFGNAGQSDWVRSSANNAFLFGADSDSNNFIVTNAWMIAKNFDHSTSIDPTIFIQSAINPDTNNEQWFSLSHDTNNAKLNVGTGNFLFNSGIVSTGTICDSVGCIRGSDANKAGVFDVNVIADLNKTYYAQLDANFVFTKVSDVNTWFARITDVNTWFAKISDINTTYAKISDANGAIDLRARILDVNGADVLRAKITDINGTYLNKLLGGIIAGDTNTIKDFNITSGLNKGVSVKSDLNRVCFPAGTCEMYLDYNGTAIVIGAG